MIKARSICCAVYGSILRSSSVASNGNAVLSTPILARSYLPKASFSWVLKSLIPRTVFKLGAEVNDANASD